jgi:hypothetical protein
MLIFLNDAGVATNIHRPRQSPTLMIYVGYSVAQKPEREPLASRQRFMAMVVANGMVDAVPEQRPRKVKNGQLWMDFAPRKSEVVALHKTSLSKKKFRTQSIAKKANSYNLQKPDIQTGKFTQYARLFLGW